MEDNAAAEPHLAQSLELFRELGDRGHEAMALNGRAVMTHEAGRTAEALDVALDALRMAEEAGHWWIQAVLESNAGRFYA